MADDHDELSRRELLKRTGATLSVLALGNACSNSNDGDGDPAEGASPSTSGAGTSGSGTPAPSAGAGAGPTPAGSGGSGAGAPPVAGAPAAGSPGSGGSAAEPAIDAGAPAGGDGGTAPDDGRVKVAIVRNNADLDAAVARAVQLAGGIDAIQPGQSVFIKVNAVSDRSLDTPGIRTSNEVMAAVVRLVKQRNPGRIVVGDRSARQFDSTQVFQNAGIEAAALAAGADEVYMAPSSSADPDAWMLVQPPGYESTWQSAGGILVMRKIVESDHLINVPACKNHRYALFTLSMKNFIGAIGDSSRDPLHFAETIASADFQPIGRDIAVLNQPFSPLINVIDATTALINGGPQGDGADAVRTSPGLILASRDRVALDALAVSLIKLELGRTDVPQPDASHDSLVATGPFPLPQIVEAGMRGIGATTEGEVALLFEDVPDASEIEAIFRG
jgi:uncharacterized protein (DUF362 family)